ncbi:MAG: hypothetical protein NTW62_01885 [Candidatus Nomurabacteria bacterium]|nr:hypothetical protein [Candidatus Nomurabacteria bacterium]
MTNILNKTIKYNTVILLSVLALIVFSFAPAKVNAGGPGYYLGNPTSVDNNNNTNNYYNVATPIIYSITPNSVSDSTNANEVINITGANFNPGSVARLDGSNRPTKYINTTHLSMALYPSDVATSGSHVVTVYNQDTGHVSNGVYLNITKTTTTVAPSTVGDYPPATTNTPAKATPAKTTTAKKALTASAINSTDCNGLTANAFGSGFMPTTFIQWLLLIILVLIAIFLARKLYMGDTKKEPVALKKA